MARRRSKPPPTTIDEQRRWLNDWLKPNLATGTSRADRAARRFARRLENVIGSEDVDHVALEAVRSAEVRLEKKLVTDAPIDSVGGGFPAYCRVVLHNEVRRQLAKQTRKFARQLEWDEAVTEAPRVS